MKRERNFRLISVLLVGFGTAISVPHLSQRVQSADSQTQSAKLDVESTVATVNEVESLNRGQGLPTFSAGESQGSDSANPAASSAPLATEKDQAR